VHELLGEIGAQRSAAFRNSLAELSPDKQRERLREAWSVLLGDVEPMGDINVRSRKSGSLGDIAFEQIVLEVEPDILVPMLLLLPDQDQREYPIVIGLSQDGKEKFLEERAEEIAALLTQGVAVFLPDVRGMGETCPDSSRQPRSEATALSATELILGRTLLGSRFLGLRIVMAYLRVHEEVTWFTL